MGCCVAQSAVAEGCKGSAGVRPSPCAAQARGVTLTPNPSPTRSEGSMAGRVGPQPVPRPNPAGFGTLAGARYISTNSMQAQPAPSCGSSRASARTETQPSGFRQALRQAQHTAQPSGFRQALRQAQHTAQPSGFRQALRQAQPTAQPSGFGYTARLNSAAEPRRRRCRRSVCGRGELVFLNGTG
jgi:hypothetical protein